MARATEAPTQFVGTFDEALQRFEASGFMLARLETLMMAGRDKRIDRTCLEVLICLIEALNRETMTCYLGRETIATRVGITVKSVSNYLSQLRALGYIASGYRPTPEANNRQLLHYTLTALSPEEIEKAITRAVQSLRGEINTVVPLETSRPNGKSSSRNSGKSHEGSRPDGKSCSRSDRKSAPSSCDDGKSSSRQDGRSNTVEPRRDSPSPTVETNNNCLGDASPPAQPSREGKKIGKRLDPAWVLPKAWGEWAMSNFLVNADQVRAEAAKFKNHFLAKSGKDAAKLDWKRTWENWCASGYTRWKRRAVDTSIAPDLVDAADEDRAVARARAEADLAEERRINELIAGGAG